MLFLSFPAAALKGEGQITGQMYGDYYYVFAHHDGAMKDNNGFWFRRIYLTFDNPLANKIAMRFRLQMSSPGDFKTSATMIPSVKDAYLSAKLGKHTVMLGLIGTPMYDNLEDFWGYRAMEKTPIDLFNFGSSRDLGIGVKGTLDKKQALAYSVVFGNGSNIKSETNHGKALYGHLNYQPIPELFFEVYADFTNTGNAGSVNVLQAFAGVKGRWGRCGLNGGVRNSKQAEARSAMKFVSLFVVFKLSPKMELVGRYDRMLDPNPNGSKIDYIPMADHAKANILLAGIGWSVNEKVKIIPNVKYIYYDFPEGDKKPHADFYTCLTLYFRF